MNVDNLLALLESKDTAVAYEALQELETLSGLCDALYPYTERFVSMTGSKKYVLRVRGFRLFCKQAQWDTDNLIDRGLAAALQILDDEKPTAVRQALAALYDVIPYKKNLHEQIRARVRTIDYLRYKDTMHSLLASDIEALLSAMDA